MTLDNETQRQLILAAIDASNWPGSLAEEIVKLKFAVRQAEIQDHPKE